MTEADTQTLINELQSKIDQLPTKGTLKALEFRLDAILQANLDTFWLLICAILVFLMQSGFMCLESGLSRNKNQSSSEYLLSDKSMKHKHHSHGKKNKSPEGPKY